MDVTNMAFCNSSFDCVVNFAGWEDFTAISGEELIDKAFSEMVRVLKANGFLAVTFTPRLSQTMKSRKETENFKSSCIEAVRDQSSLKKNSSISSLRGME
jgi:ubiquinone/menaquinone biosynthesis C-methylase UbiE